VLLGLSAHFKNFTHSQYYNRSTTKNTRKNTINIIITLFGIVRSNFAVPKKELVFEIKTVS
jgi:hypothetical protein